MKFRKKPVIIDATQWFKNGDHPEDRLGEVLVDQLSPDNRSKDYKRQEGAVVRYYRHPANPGTTLHVEGDFACGKSFHDHGWIDTAEGGHIVCPGDWVITGVEGERYPCKPGIFARTYDAVA